MSSIFYSLSAVTYNHIPVLDRRTSQHLHLYSNQVHQLPVTVTKPEGLSLETKHVLGPSLYFLDHAHLAPLFWDTAHHGKPSNPQ